MDEIKSNSDRTQISGPKTHHGTCCIFDFGSRRRRKRLEYLKEFLLIEKRGESGTLPHLSDKVLRKLRKYVADYKTLYPDDDWGPE